MNYFYFQQFLLDLEENKYIMRYDKEESEVYEITENGRSTLALTIDMLPRNYKNESRYKIKRRAKRHTK